MPSLFDDESSRRNATRTADDLIACIERDLTQLLLNPRTALAEPVLEIYTGLLRNWVALRQALSQSNPGYWQRDLPTEVRASYESAQHALRLLERVYGPQEVKVKAGPTNVVNVEPDRRPTPPKGLLP